MGARRTLQLVASTRRTLLLAAVLLAGLAGCQRGEPTARDYLRSAWESYKPVYVAEPGYVLDRTRGDGEAISEGQGYALLRAAWMCDLPAFERTFRWVEANLRRPDGLYAWAWSARRGALIDSNTATDGDQEIAFALILAAHAFARPDFESRARELLVAIRTHEAIEVPGGWFPAAGNWAVTERIVNLSYFLPYAYPDFARVDPDGGWDRVTDTGYALLGRVLQQPGVKLPPDFIVVTPDGAIAPLPTNSTLGRDFSFDAMRLYFRVALDCALYHRPQACDGPLRAGALVELLQRDGAIYTRYATSGRALTADESLSFYGGILPLLAQQAPTFAAHLRAGKLSLPDLQTISDHPDRYYDLNWVWFGIAADQGLLLQGDRLRCAPSSAAAAS
jgi:endo-1,4-beta-D-glucanase Y